MLEGLDQLKRAVAKLEGREPSPLMTSLPLPDGREGRLDQVGGAQVEPVR